MHPQLFLLMELQDLRSQQRELQEGVGTTRAMEQEEFHMDLELALVQLSEKIVELEGALAPGVQERYRRVLPQRERFVVPVISGVCYGCFVSIPTATVGEWDVVQDLRSCENCGRFIYILP
jgi:predicted  nucleic acid-binding Zn-ribbon protein